MQNVNSRNNTWNAPWPNTFKSGAAISNGPSMAKMVDKHPNLRTEDTN